MWRSLVLLGFAVFVALAFSWALKTGHMIPAGIAIGVAYITLCQVIERDINTR